MIANKQLTKSKLIQFFCSDFARGLFTGMVANYLVYILQTDPTKTGLPVLLPNNKFLGFLTVLSIITLVSKIFDAVSDPLLANLSDKSKNPRGRRIPFMQVSAVPYAICCVMIFFAPFKEQSIGNALWVGVFMVLYFLFYTIYSIPQRALIPEILPDAKQRVGAYSISTVFFMGGSAIAYTAEMLVALIKKSGIASIWAWRIVFVVFGVIGMVLLLVSAFCIKEKEYLKTTKPPQEKFLSSFKKVVKNKQFMIVTFGDLFNYIAMAFFQSTMFYYMTY
ncbi:MAG: MFS transporter, partial [Clostridia bacterium]